MSSKRIVIKKLIAFKAVTYSDLSTKPLHLTLFETPALSPSTLYDTYTPSQIDTVDAIRFFSKIHFLSIPERTSREKMCRSGMEGFKPPWEELFFIFQ